MKPTVGNYQWGDGKLGEAELTPKHHMVVDTMELKVSVYALQEVKISQKISEVLLNLLNRHGIQGVYSAPRTGDGGAGVLILWRANTWTLRGSPATDQAGRVLTVCLRCTHDDLDYYFTCVYLPTASHSSVAKRASGLALRMATTGRAHGPPTG